MAHTQKPDFVFRRNGGVHSNRRGRQFSRLLAAEVCTSAGSTAEYTTFRDSVKSTGYPTPFASFPSTSPHVRHRAPSHFNWPLRTLRLGCLLLQLSHYTGYRRQHFKDGPTFTLQKNNEKTKKIRTIHSCLIYKQA
jgi:hypothetical protein